MGNNIGEIKYNEYLAQKGQIKQRTEKSINSLFNRNVINEEQKNTLLKMYLSGQISFGEDGLTEAEARNFTAETYEEIVNESKNNQNKDVKTLYTIQPGDTPKVIAKKLGLSGEEAKNFARKLQAQAIKDRVYYEFGFKVGDMVQLPGDFREQLEQQKAQGTYTTNDKELDSNYQKVIQEKEAAKAPEVKPEPEPEPVEEGPTPEELEKQQKQKELERTKERAKILAKNLQEVIEDDSISGMRKNKFNKSTLEVLSLISSDEIAYVVKEYKKNTGTSLAIAIDNELGLDIETARHYICNKLLNQAHKLKIFNLPSFYEIKDIEELDNWIEMASNKIISTMEGIKTNTKIVNGRTVETITDKPVYKEAGINKVEQVLANDGNVLEKTYYYENGKVVKEYATSSYYDSSKGKRIISNEFEIYKTGSGTWIVKDKTGKKLMVDQEEETFNYNGKEYQIAFKRELIKSGPINPKEEEPKIKKPLAFEIELPPDASENAKMFAKALQDNKAKLMKLLNLDSDSYNRFARLAMAIAEQETNFGMIDGKKRRAKFNASEALADTIASDVIAQLKGSALSQGVTQIKYNDQIKDPDVKAFFEALGIKSESDLASLENSAMGTIVLLTVFSKRMKNANVQKGIEAAQGVPVEYSGWELVNGHAQKTGNTKAWVNEITDEDILCYYWNEGPRKIINGNIDPEGNAYARNIRKYLDKYHIKEDENLRLQELENAEIRRKYNNTNAYAPVKNNGDLGSIIIGKGPKCEKENEEYILIKNALKKNKISQDSATKLLNELEAGNFSFKYGLTEKEADSLTQNDVDLILKYIELSKNGVPNVNSDFKKEYLESKAKKVAIRDIETTSVVSLNGNIKAPTTFKGKVADTGVKTSSGKIIRYSPATNQWTIPNFENLTASDLLALYAQCTALERNSGGHCMTYFRQALIKAGVDAAMSENIARNVAESGTYIFVDPKTKARHKVEHKNKDYEYNTEAGYYLNNGTAKGSVSWFESHPEMFEEVKFVDIGGGQARQITSADLPNLPAGYIVLWVPGEGDAYKNQPGHASITNGNGLAYSDETDNLGWGDFTTSDVEHGSGKGEHGTFRVFRLTDKWVVDPQTGQLVFNG